MTYAERVNAARRDILRDALAASGGNVTHAARRLGLQRTYLVKLIREHLPEQARGPIPPRLRATA